MIAKGWRWLRCGAFLKSREEYGGAPESLLSMSVAHGVIPRDVDAGRAASEDLSGYRRVQPSDLVVNRLVARDGAFAISQYEGSVSPAYWVLVCDRRVAEPSYLHHAFKSKELLAEVWRRSKDMPPAQFDLPWQLFKTMPVLLPPLATQRAIADYLDRELARIDKLIDEQQRLIDMLKERKLLIVAHAIPKDGPKGRMKWDTRMVAGGTPATDVDDYWLGGDDEDGTPFVAIGDMSRRRSVTSTAKRLSESAMASRAMPVGQPGTLLLAMYASVGEVAMLDIEATWNQAILGITPDPTRLDANFLRYALLQMRSDLLRDVRSNTQANLNASQVGSLWVPMPPLEEQRRIAADLDAQTEKLDTMLAETERFIELARERRSALISAAVTGQIDVREVA